MTTLAWLFMIVSVGFVTGLMIWCFRKVLGHRDKGD
jgi:choline-glycine betaine transporter